jgi:hypothetical protein
MATSDNRKHYPEDPKERMEFWRQLMKASEAQMDPYIKAGVRLTKLYNAMGTTTREKSLDTFDHENINRVKGSIVFAWVDQSMANMYDDDIKFKLSPRNPHSKNGVPIVEAAINDHYEDSSQAEEDYQMCLQAHLMPFAVKKVGWSSVLEEQDELFGGNLSNLVIDDPELENEAFMGGKVTKVTIRQDGTSHIAKHIEALEDPQLSRETAEIIEDHIGFHEELEDFRTSPEMNARVVWESPYGTAWDIDDYRQDPAARKNNKDARWVAFRVRQQLSWWKSRFGEDADGLKPNASSDVNRPKNDDDNAGFEDFGLVEGWEVWAKDFPIAEGKTADIFLIFVEGHDKILVHEDEWPHNNLDEYPAIILQFQQNLKTWINKPTLTLAGADNIQQIMNEFFDSMLYTIRKQKNLWLYDSDLFTQDQMDEILRAPDNTAYGIEGLSDVGSRAIVPIPFTQVGSEKTEFLSLIQNYFDRSAGTPQPIRTPGEKTATEIGVVEKRNTAREDARRRRYNKMQVDTARLFWRLHQEYQPDTQFLIDPRLEEWSEVTPDVAKGEYRFKVRVTNRLESQQVQRKSLMDLFNLAVGTIPAFLQLKLQPPNIVELFERLIREGFDIQDVHNILPQVPSQFEEQVKALQDDPEALMNALNAFQSMGGGGSFGPLGNGPGPANPQLAAAPPTTDSGEAKRAEGAGQGQ